MFYFFARSLNNTIYIYTYVHIPIYTDTYVYTQILSHAQLGGGSVCPPPTRWPREGVDPPPLILAISYSGEGQSPINPSINFRRFLQQRIFSYYKDVMMILKMRNFILIFPKLFWGATAPKTIVKGRGHIYMYIEKLGTIQLRCIGQQATLERTTPPKSCSKSKDCKIAKSAVQKVHSDVYRCTLQI